MSWVSPKMARGATRVRGYSKQHKKQEPEIRPLTEKQERIVSGEIPPDEVPLNQLTLLIKKLTILGRIDESERFSKLREKKQKEKQRLEEANRNSCMGSTRTKAECKQILNELTPQWIIDLKEQISTGKITNIARAKERHTEKYRQENRKRREEEAKLSFRTKKINQYTAKGEFIQQFPSIKAAAKEVGGTSGNLSNAARNRRKAYGFYWDYAEDR